MRKKITTFEFIERAVATHGNTYDYSLVKYEGTDKKVEIVCPIHGSFFQSPHSHVGAKKMGCKLCGVTKRSSGRKLTLSAFIKKAKVVHNKKFDYSKAMYINGSTKVEIVCPTHGSFWQTPGSHLAGIGCSACSGNLRGTTKSFIEKAKTIHGDMYGYEKVVYVKTEEKVDILCYIHGIFSTTPHSHISMQSGCPSCAEIKRFSMFQSNNTPALLYYIKIVGTPYFKIGITTRNVEKRFEGDRGLTEIIKVWSMGAFDAFTIEQEILNEATNLRYTGEPILRGGGNTEILTKDILPLIEYTIKKFVT